MIKGYSGVFRLGEATSTWDADSPVCSLETKKYNRLTSFYHCYVLEKHSFVLVGYPA